MGFQVGVAVEISASAGDEMWIITSRCRQGTKGGGITRVGHEAATEHDTMAGSAGGCSTEMLGWVR
jgi:hypothetical protein